MIDYFFGKPRTGKTYRAMHLIYADYMTDKTPQYRYILTNIGGFKFDLFNRYFEDKGLQSRVYKLVFKDFYLHLEKLYKMSLDEKSDDELIRYARYHNFDDCLIVIDEAFRFFKKYDQALAWFLSYHGHFKIRIIMITQSPKQILSEYMEHAEIYINAQPQSKQLSSNTLRYIHYDEPRFIKDNKFSSDSIKASPEIFELYKSGAVDKPKKIIYKFIGIGVGALIAVVIIFNLFLTNMQDRAGISDQTEMEIVSDLPSNITNNYISLDIELVCVRCNDQYCWNSDHKYEHKPLSMAYFKNVVVKNELVLQFSEVENEIYKLKEARKGYKKITLASLIDYYYLIPDDVMNTYLSLWKIPVKIEKQSPFTNMPKPFDQDSDKATINPQNSGLGA